MVGDRASLRRAGQSVRSEGLRQGIPGNAGHRSGVLARPAGNDGLPYGLAAYELGRTGRDGRVRVDLQGRLPDVLHLQDHRSEDGQGEGLEHAVQEGRAVFGRHAHARPHGRAVGERRGQILRHAAGRRRLRSFDLLSGARGDEPHRYGISHHADPGTHSALPSRHVAQHSVSARAVSGAAGQHPSRDRREVRRGGRAVGVGGKPSRQGAREGACDGGHRKRRRAHGTLLESRVPGHRHAEQGLD